MRGARGGGGFVDVVRRVDVDVQVTKPLTRMVRVASFGGGAREI